MPLEIIQDIGSYAGFAAVVGLAVLSALYFSQARDVKRLREWAGRAPERSETPVPGRVVAQPQQPRAAAPAVPGQAARPAAATAAAGATPQVATQPAGEDEAASDTGEEQAVAAGANGDTGEHDLGEESPDTGERAAVEATPDTGEREAVGAPSDTGERDAVGATSDTGEGPAVGEDGDEDAIAAEHDEELEDEREPVSAGATATAAGAGAAAASAAGRRGEAERAAGEGPEGLGPAGPDASAAPPAAPPAGDAPAPAPAPRPQGPPSRPPAPTGAPAGRSGLAGGPPRPAARPGSPPLRTRAPGRPGGLPRAAQTAIIPPPSRAPWYRRLLASPRYLVLAIAGVLIVGGGAAFGIAQLAGEGGGEQASQSPAGDSGSAAGSGSDDDRPAGSNTRAIDPKRVTVSVLNGTTVPGLAAQLGDKIEGFGFQLGNVTNSTDQQRAESVVLYAPNHEREAAAVARRLRIGQRERIDAQTQGLAGDATVVVIAGIDQTR